MQMSRNDIIEKLKNILVTADSKNTSVVDKLNEDSNLTTDLGLSSVGMLYLVIAIEEFFNIRFDNVGVNDFIILKDVIDYIEGKI